MIHLLILGAGPIATSHIQAYTTMAHVQIAGIVPITSDQTTVQQDIPQFASVEAAVNDLPTIDAIDICVPTHLHKAYIEKVAAFGKPVICSEPLARNKTDLEQMMNVCDTNHVQLLTGYVTRFTPAYAQAKAAIEAGAIGQPGIVRTTRNNPFPPDTDQHDVTIDDLMVNVLSQDFDFLQWCFGEVERVYAKSIAPEHSSSVIYALVTLRFTCGAIAHVEGSYSDQHASSSFELAGDAGMINFDSRTEQTIEFMTYGESNNAFLSPIVTTPLAKRQAHFIDCLSTKQKPMTSALDSYRAVSVSLAALESIQTNEPVTINHAKVGGLLS